MACHGTITDLAFVESFGILFIMNFCFNIEFFKKTVLKYYLLSLLFWCPLKLGAQGKCPKCWP